MSDSETLHIKWPWTLIPLEFEREFLDALEECIGPEHPLFGKELHATAKRQGEDMYAILDLDRMSSYGGKPMPSVTFLKSSEEFRLRMEKDLQEAIADTE